MADFEYNQRDVNEVKAAYLNYQRVESQALGLGVLGFFGALYQLPRTFRLPRGSAVALSVLSGSIVYNTWLSGEKFEYQKTASRANTRASERLNQLMNI